jgi:glyoxylase-like metal-dependent hydrolase (beta-lactamase superfamily II)
VIELGEIRVHLLSDGVFALDGGAIFGVVPRTLWERHDVPDERNRVTLGLNVPLIEAGGRRILVDTGMGERWGERERQRYRLDRSVTLLDGLARLGLAPEDIDVVVNSHLHFDHAGGNTRLRDGRPEPTFPRARYLVQKGEWEDATHPHERNRVSYREADFVPVAESGQLELVEGEVQIAPGVHVAPAGGHTAHHQMVRVDGGGHTLVVPTDILPTASHLPLAYIMSYDLYPVGTLEAKRGLLRQAAEEGWQIVFYHDPRTPVSGVRVNEDRYVLNGVSL